MNKLVSASIIVLLSGCVVETEPAEDGQSADTESASSALCDGSTNVRLVARIEGGGDGVSDLDIFYDVEPGTAYVYVLGTCEYFAYPLHGSGEWTGVRTGTLDAQKEAALAAAMAYDDLATLEGFYSGGSGTGAILSDGVHTITAHGGDEEQGVPDAFRVIDEWSQTLWNEGTPYGGGLHIYANPRDAEYELATAIPWQAEVSLESFAYASPDGSSTYWVGTSRFIPESPGADWLREVVAGASQTHNGALYFKEGPPGAEQLYEVALRDALPFESPEGVVVAPLPCRDSSCSYGLQCVDGYCQGSACTAPCSGFSACVEGQCYAP